eukprot:CAMPEP_0194237464 /NCGR_PEP_ID=MMETSP0158-20130606/4461_1 /TAXON_ID=33649 /ORGANISM="Thalassionema nitzschioides, Strain L26-B" /LENGTH=402 /DNA_ID=CAMNT_0038971501 /DNA_START=19 /DNA_END=1228 /DNA_ORIENTATION=+
MVKKRKRHDDGNVRFHRDFQEPTDEDRAAALGDFPMTEQQPDALFQCTPCASKEDLDDSSLYLPTRTKIPKPTFELDWLAKIPEEGQSLRDYIRLLKSRSGRMKPIANAIGTTICLLPIVSSADQRQWPNHAPQLESLASLTRAFYQRPVKLLDPATIDVTFSHKTKPIMRFYYNKEHTQILGRHKIKGRRNVTTERSQCDLISTLDAMSWYRRNHSTEENFCIMGMTMEDLYEGSDSKSLFCARMAFGGDKVAAFSFHRCRPHLRMSPLEWWNYGYSKRSGRYSYFDSEKGPTISLSREPPGMPTKGGLLEYNVGVVSYSYGLDHCIYYKCLMMGSGHLVEDFETPLFVCGMCLRKLQWRLGFSVEQRYRDVASSLKEMSLSSEAGWHRRQLGLVKKQREK